MPLWRRILIGPVKFKWKIEFNWNCSHVSFSRWTDKIPDFRRRHSSCLAGLKMSGVKPEAWIDTPWLQLTHFRLLQKIYTVRSDSVRLYQSKHVGCDSVICHCVPRLQRKIYIYYIYLLGLGVIHCWKCRAQRLAAKQCPHMPAVSSLNKAYTQFSPYIYPTQCSRHIKRLPWDH